MQVLSANFFRDTFSKHSIFHSMKYFQTIITNEYNKNIEQVYKNRVSELFTFFFTQKYASENGIFYFSGDSNTGLHKRSIYENSGATVCSQKRALCIATVVFAILFAISLIIAFAGPQNGTKTNLKKCTFFNFTIKNN